MKLFGAGCIKHPKTGKVIWDFEDGPFETDDLEIIEQEQSKRVGTEKPKPMATVGEKDKESLIERAAELNLGPRSILKRWSIERLDQAIMDKETEPEDDGGE